jgi:hypothetical protein
MLETAARASRHSHSMSTLPPSRPPIPTSRHGSLAVDSVALAERGAALEVIGPVAHAQLLSGPKMQARRSARSGCLLGCAPKSSSVSALSRARSRRSLVQTHDTRATGRTGASPPEARTSPKPGLSRGCAETRVCLGAAWDRPIERRVPSSGKPGTNARGRCRASTRGRVHEIRSPGRDRQYGCSCPRAAAFGSGGRVGTVPALHQE